MRAYLINRIQRISGVNNSSVLASLTNQELLNLLNQHLYTRKVAALSVRAMYEDAAQRQSTYKKGSSHGTSDQG